MEHPECLWLQVDIGGGGWATDYLPVVADDGYVASGAGGMLGVGGGGVVEPPPVPPMALTIRGVADGLGLLLDDDGGDSDSEIDMGSSPPVAKAGKGLRGAGRGHTGPLVEPVVLFPAVPVSAETVVRCAREGTVPDSVDGDEADLSMDPACGGGSRAGGCECSSQAELGHLNGKVRKLEDMVRLLIADAGLAGWEETRRVGNLSRRMKFEWEVAERDHTRRLAAERAASEEKKMLAKRIEWAKRAEEVRESQVVAAKLRDEQIEARKAALEVSVEECVQATNSEELVPRAAKVAKAAEGVERAVGVPSPTSEDVDVGGGWRVVGGSVVRRVEVVSRFGGPVGRTRTAGLPKLVEEVQALLRSESMGWGVSAKVWSKHGCDEVLWTVSGVGKSVGDSGVLDRLKMNVVAAVGTAEVVDW